MSENRVWSTCWINRQMRTGTRWSLVTAKPRSLQRRHMFDSMRIEEASTRLLGETGALTTSVTRMTTDAVGIDDTINNRRPRR